MPPSTSSIELAALPPEVARRVQWALDEALRSHSHDRWMEDALGNGTDAELIAAAEEEYPATPIGLSNWYKDIWPEQETIFNRCALYRGRRPVLMKGAKQVLIRRHCLSISGNSANGWAISVYWRALRMSKRTFSSYDEFEKWDRDVASRLRSKYYLTSSFARGTGVEYCAWSPWKHWEKCARVVGGKLVFLSPSEAGHISKLQEIIRKTENLDQTVKRAMAKAAMLERLAA